jgi:hypothetical protein
VNLRTPPARFGFTRTAAHSQHSLAGTLEFNKLIRQRPERGTRKYAPDCAAGEKASLQSVRDCAWRKCGVDMSPYGGVAMSAEPKTAHFLWYPLEPDCPFSDHEWRVEREARDAGNTQALVYFFRRPIRQGPRAAGGAVCVSSLRDSRYSGPRESSDAYATPPTDAEAA